MNQMSMSSGQVVVSSGALKVVAVVAATFFFMVASFATISFISSRSHARVNGSAEAGAQ